MNDRFDAFVAPARGHRSGWFLGLGIGLIVVFYAEFLMLILLVMQLAQGGVGNIGMAMAGLARGNTPLAMILTLSTFIAMMGSVVLTATVLRDRSPLSLVGKGPVLRNFALATVVLSALLAFGTIIAHFQFDLVANIAPLQWLAWAPLALPLLLVQVSAEELIFRGFLLQELAARFKNPAVWLLVPSVIFGALHWDSDTFGSNAWLIVVDTTIFAIIAADVTIRTGNLGAAIGLHFVNNFFAMFVTSLQGNMNGLSMYVTPFTASDESTLRVLLYWDIAFLISAYLVYLVVIHLKRGR